MSRIERKDNLQEPEEFEVFTDEEKHALAKSFVFIPSKDEIERFTEWARFAQFESLVLSNLIEGRAKITAINENGAPQFELIKNKESEVNNFMGKIEPREGVEVYVSVKCNVIIKQETSFGENMIIIHPDDVPKVIEFLQEALQQALNCEPENDENEV